MLQRLQQRALAEKAKAEEQKLLSQQHRQQRAEKAK